MEKAGCMNGWTPSHEIVPAALVTDNLGASIACWMVTAAVAAAAALRAVVHRRGLLLTGLALGILGPAFAVIGDLVVAIDGQPPAQLERRFCLLAGRATAESSDCADAALDSARNPQTVASLDTHGIDEIRDVRAEDGL